MVEFGVQLSLKDNFSMQIKKMIGEQKRLRKDLTVTKKMVGNTFKKEYELKIKNNKAVRAINFANKKMSELGKMTITPVVKIKDMTGRTFESIKRNALSLKGVLGGLAVGYGTSKVLESGAMLEQQKVAMEHFIAVNNEGLSKDAVVKLKDSYINMLRNNANQTPFTTQEVISAGARAINIAQGNTSQAMDVVKLAENMAALNPEKSLSDAIEALADAKVGEFERLKEFGFKISADEFKKFVGKDKNDDLTDAETVKAYQQLINTKLSPYFSGGAEKLSSTGAGLWSTVKGKLGTGIQDMGLNILENLKPTLQQVIKLIDDFTPAMNKWSNNIASGVKIAVDLFSMVGKVIGKVMPVIRVIISNVSDWIKEKMELLGQHTDWLGKMFNDVWNGIKEVVPVVWGIIKPYFDFIVAVINVILVIIKTLYPVIKRVFEGVWKVVKPILIKFGELVKGIADFLQSSGFLGVIEKVFGVVGKIISGAWGIIEPILKGIKTLLFGIVDGVIKVGKWFGSVFGSSNKKEVVINQKKSDNDVYKELFNNNNSLKISNFNGAVKRSIGINRVPYNNYAVLAHEGERLLTKKEAKQYDNKNSININKFADMIVIREEADINKFAELFVRKLEQRSLNFGGVR